MAFFSGSLLLLPADVIGVTHMVIKSKILSYIVNGVLLKVGGVVVTQAQLFHMSVQFFQSSH